MRAFLSAPWTWFTLGCLALYGLLFWAAGYEITVYTLAALIFGFAAVGFATWLTTFVETSADGGRRGLSRLALSLCYFLVFALYTRLWIVAKQSLGFPDWMDKHWGGPIAGVILLMAIIGVVFTPDKSPLIGTRRQAFYLVVAGMLAGVFLGITITLALVRGVPPEEQAPRTPTLFQSVPMLPTCEADRPVLVRAYCRARPGTLM